MSESVLQDYLRRRFDPRARRSASDTLARRAGVAEARAIDVPGPGVEFLRASADLLPVTGNLRNAARAWIDARNGQLGSAAWHAGLALLPVGIARRNGYTGAARNRVGYEPPQAAPRDLAKDYPHAPPVDGAGRVLADIEGRPIGAPLVAGRRSIGGSDEGLAAADVRGLAAKITDRFGVAPVDKVLDAEGRQVAGWFGKTRSGKREIRISEALSDQEKALTIAHEAGHAIADIARKTKVAAGREKVQLEKVFHELGTGQRLADGKAATFTPQAAGYQPKEWAGELIAEGLRAYLTRPGYFKAVAPDAARSLREAVNTHPVLSRHVHLNSVGAGAVGIAAAAGERSIERTGARGAGMMVLKQRSDGRTAAYVRRQGGRAVYVKSYATPTRGGR